MKPANTSMRGHIGRGAKAPLRQLDHVLDTLEAFYGKQVPSWPTDPYLFMVWWHCGYPASDASCARGWESLNNEIGVDPEVLLATKPSKLSLALKPGGMMPELRAMRLKEIAERIQKQFGGDLMAAFKGASVAQLRASIKKFPSIADPGTDRILLFGRISPVAAVPSNCPHVLVRIKIGCEQDNYVKTYSEAQRIIETEIPVSFNPRIRTYLLLKCHGQRLCKRTNPKCSVCPVRTSCAFFVV